MTRKPAHRTSPVCVCSEGRDYAPHVHCAAETGRMHLHYVRRSSEGSLGAFTRIFSGDPPRPGWGIGHE